jgi:phytoene dehydrogenase-like protein
MRLMHHATLGQGPGAVTGPGADAGPGELVGLLESTLRERGVQVRTGTAASRILVRGDRVEGIVAGDDEEIRAPLILSALDPASTLLDLVGRTAFEPELQRDLESYRCTGRTAKIHLLADRLPGFLQPPDGGPPVSHAFLADDLDDLEKAHDAGKYGRVAERPSLDLFVAGPPDGGTPGTVGISLLVESAPSGSGSDDPEEAEEELFRRAIEGLEARDPGFSSAILDRRILAPSRLQELLGIRGGHLHQGDLTLDQFHALRPNPRCARYATPIQGLYLCGAGTHPGGASGGLSGVLAAREALHREDRGGRGAADVRRSG